jgi:Leucine-rich repeat (LRR) protein
VQNCARQASCNRRKMTLQQRHRTHIGGSPRAFIASKASVSTLPLPLTITSRQSAQPQDEDVTTVCDISSLLDTFGIAALLTDTDNPRYRALQWFLASTSTSTITSTTTSTTTQVLECPFDDATDELMQTFVMATFYYALGGDGWTNSENWLSSQSHVCDWEGITCDNSNDDNDNSDNDGETGDSGPSGTGNITALNLASNNLVGGPIPGNALAQLRSLRELDMSNNALTRKIPNGLYALTDSLQVLNLAGNQLSGTISDRMGELTQLTTLRLDNNELSGRIPTTLANLPNLGK